MDLPKKAWEKPQLIILARGTPQESVLEHCKYIGGGGGNGRPDTYNQDGCNDFAITNCGTCQARAGS